MAYWVRGILFLGFFLGLGGTGSLHAASKLTLVALGDSTTAGTPGFRSPLEAPPHGSGNEQSQYIYWIMKRHPEWKVLNRGVAGERSDQILKRFDRDVLPHRPDGLIVLAGVNDLVQGYPIQHIQRNLAAIYRRTAKENIRLIVCTILPYNSASQEIYRNLIKINKWIRDYAAQHKTGFCDTFRAVEDPKNPGNLAGTSDGLHPDPEGYRRIGEALTEVLEREFPST